MTSHPALVQQSAPLIHSTPSDPEDTAIKLAAACFTRVIGAKARDARATYSVSIANFCAEFGIPLMCLTFNSSNSVVKGFPSRCFVIRSAGFNLEFLVFLLEVPSFHVFDGAAPTAESQPSYCCSVCPDSCANFVSKLLSQYSDSAPFSDTTFCVDDQVAKVC